MLMIYPHDGTIECELKRRQQERERKRVQRGIDRRLAREVGIWHGNELVKELHHD